MIFTETKLKGAFVIDLEQRLDSRGFFARAFCQKEFEAHGLKPIIAQANVAHNVRKGTLRGMHFQFPPAAETKLVRCTRGALYDVIVDLRPDSPAYTSWTAVELSAENRVALYIPKGLAHGFQTLVDGTEVAYAISEPYEPGSAGGVRWDDPTFGIDWPEAEERVMSEKDQSWPDFTR